MTTQERCWCGHHERYHKGEGYFSTAENTCTLCEKQNVNGDHAYSLRKRCWCGHYERYHAGGSCTFCDKQGIVRAHIYSLIPSCWCLHKKEVHNVVDPLTQEQHSLCPICLDLDGVFEVPLSEWETRNGTPIIPSALDYRDYRNEEISYHYYFPISLVPPGKTRYERQQDLRGLSTPNLTWLRRIERFGFEEEEKPTSEEITEPVKSEEITRPVDVPIYYSSDKSEDEASLDNIWAFLLITGGLVGGCIAGVSLGIGTFGDQTLGSFVLALVGGFGGAYLGGKIYRSIANSKK